MHNLACAYVRRGDGRGLLPVPGRAAGLTEVNFWRPRDTREFRAIGVGELFFFKTHAPHNRIVGGGFYSSSATSGSPDELLRRGLPQRLGDPARRLLADLEGSQEPAGQPAW